VVQELFHRHNHFLIHLEKKKYLRKYFMRKYLPVRKLTTISKRKKASEITLKIIHRIELISSLKNAIATGKTITFVINNINIIKSQ
jgi:hypothetical protein